MLNTIQSAGIAATMFAHCLLSAAADLSMIDRSIGDEPQYKSQPRYCLLVFGEKARTRVWLVEDGETIYVDRNANGDLTEKLEAIEPTKKRDLQDYREAAYEGGELVPADGSPKHTDFQLIQYQTAGKPVHYIVKVRVNGKHRQFAGWRPIFSESRQNANVIHFGGEFTPRPLREKEWSLKRGDQELHLCLFTPGLGDGTNAMLGYEAVPSDVVPLAHIEWPSAESDTTIQTEVALVHRC